MSTALAYVVTSNYISHTALSAAQARANLPATTPVYIVEITDDDALGPRLKRFSSINEIEFISVSFSAIDGMSPYYGRLYLDRLLPRDLDQVLYLDGDTQVIGDIGPLVRAHLNPEMPVAAARDPLAYLQHGTSRAAQRGRALLAQSGLPPDRYDGYVNSGMMLIQLSALGELRSRIENTRPHWENSSRFHDQDAINWATGGTAAQLSQRWNYPGFMLGSATCSALPPRVIHFMSRPRPWSGPYWPWGSEFYDRYGQLAQAFPDLPPTPNDPRFRRWRYTIQQQYKRIAERPIYDSPSFSASFEALELLATKTERELGILSSILGDNGGNE